MAMLFVTDYEVDIDLWRREFLHRLPELDFRVWPEIGDPADIEVIVIDTLMGSKGGFAPFPNLRWVSYLGHGVGDILRDPSLPPNVIVTRLNSEDLAQRMAEYALHAVLARHLRVVEFAKQQEKRIWRRLRIPPAQEQHAAVLGLGVIGRAIVRHLRFIGFHVTGWSRTGRPVEGIESRHGLKALHETLSHSDYVIAALPETDQTIGLIGRETIASMKQGTHFVNLGRGSLVVEDDLIAALDSGHLGGATLDVFQTEPLPAYSPLWGHSRVRVTPHGGFAEGENEPVDIVADNFRRLQAGQELQGQASRSAGY